MYECFIECSGNTAPWGAFFIRYYSDVSTIVGKDIASVTCCWHAQTFSVMWWISFHANASLDSLTLVQSSSTTCNGMTTNSLALSLIFHSLYLAFKGSSESTGTTSKWLMS